jgi:Zn-dependent M32 family carboxypeptidase
MSVCYAEISNAVIEWVKQSALRLSLVDCAEEFTQFASAKKIKITDAKQLLQALFSLEGLRSVFGFSSVELVELLAGDAKEGEPKEDFTRVKSQLVSFFDNSVKFERIQRAQRVYDGLLPNFEDCYSMVEFRPVFDVDRRQILNGIIAATLTLSMRPTDKTVETKQVSVQLDAADIQKLIAELDRLKTKMRALKNLVSKEVQLLNPTQSLGSKDE